MEEAKKFRGAEPVPNIDGVAAMLLAWWDPPPDDPAHPFAGVRD